MLADAIGGQGAVDQRQLVPSAATVSVQRTAIGESEI
jgi:hypothetical protein